MRIALALLLTFGAGLSFGKLPPLSEEAKTLAAATAAKNAWTDKIGAYQLCKAMDRTAASYKKSTAAAGNPATTPTPTPPCADPGPFIPPVAQQARPLEASGAHSPPETTTAPPGSKATAAEIKGTAKK